MTNDLMIPDTWNDHDGADDRIIQGTLIKCTDGHWLDRDKQPLPKPTQLIALSTLTVLQHWQANKPIETIVKKPGEPLPDVDALNAAIPAGQWETGLDGQPRPPWQQQHIVYMIDERSAEKFTFINATTGARIAVDQLKDKVRLMRALRGADVFPLIELSAKPMKTKFGTKQRPDFRVIEWRQLGGGHHQPVPIEPPKPVAIGKPVKPVTTSEMLDDEIPF